MTEAHLDRLDRLILDLVQKRFPLVEQPYTAVAGQVGVSEDDVIHRLGRLKDDGVVREIGAIFDSARLGYHSVLVAMAVDRARLDRAAAAVSAHPGVSHNYERDHRFNLWFTLTVRRERSLQAEVERLAGSAGVEEFLLLPAIRRFKIRVEFDLGTANEAPADETEASGGTGIGSAESPRPRVLTEAEIEAVRVLQRDLPLESRPFRALAAPTSLSEADLLGWAERFLAAGVMRRYGAVLRHQRLGYGANAMVAWRVAQAQIGEAGRRAAVEQAVSHCYERRVRPPRWPYNLITMIHGRSEQELQAVIERLRAQLQPEDYAVLPTVREFKKKRVRYFEAGL